MRTDSDQRSQCLSADSAADGSPNDPLGFVALRDVSTLPTGTRICVRGRVLRVRRLARIGFAILHDQGAKLQVTLEGPLLASQVSRGDVLAVSGCTGRYSGTLEVYAESVDVLARPTSSDSPGEILHDALDETRLEALCARAVVSAKIHEFFAERGFLPVQSPTLVDGWVVGQTSAFAVSFYEEPCYLAISNMLHHQAVLASGFSRIYELGKLFRQERPSSPHRLAEFTILDIGMAYSSIQELIMVTEDLIASIHEAVARLNLKRFSIPDGVSFETVEYSDVLAAAGLRRTTGSQLPSKAKRWLQDQYESFVWVRGFHQSTRPFFVRSAEERCFDAQLWYRGKQYVASGGEREVWPDVATRKIRDEMKSPDDYGFYLSTLRAGAPPMAGIGMGLERFLAAWIGPSRAADFTAFPRYSGRLIP